VHGVVGCHFEIQFVIRKYIELSTLAANRTIFVALGLWTWVSLPITIKAAHQLYVADTSHMVKKKLEMKQN
jgi:hypothetical protein